MCVEEKAAQNLDDFESTVEDVSKTSEVSIFKQLSNRYILTASVNNNWSLNFSPNHSNIILVVRKAFYKILEILKEVNSENDFLKRGN